MANDTTTTTDHDEIKAWAERHGAVPASPRGTGDDEDPGVLTFDIEGYGADEESLEHLGWEEWLQKFDDANLALLYQDEKKDGEESTFFKLISRDG